MQGNLKLLYYYDISKIIYPENSQIYYPTYVHKSKQEGISSNALDKLLIH